MGIGDIERVFWVPGFAEAEMEQRLSGGAQQGFDMRAACEVFAIGPPGANHGIGPICAFKDCRVIVGAVGVG